MDVAVKFTRNLVQVRHSLALHAVPHSIVISTEREISCFDTSQQETSVWRSLGLPPFAESLSVAIPPHTAYVIQVIDES